MDFNETLFKRTLVKAHRDNYNEEKNLMAEELTVTKEANGYALWYQGREIYQPRIIAWSQYNKYDVIAYAVQMDVDRARIFAEDGIVEYNILSLDKLAQEPVVEKS